GFRSVCAWSEVCHSSCDRCRSPSSLSFLFNDTATTEIYTLSLHDALPIFRGDPGRGMAPRAARLVSTTCAGDAKIPSPARAGQRSEEHTSELQSRENLVCRLLLEKKKQPRDKRPLRERILGEMTRLPSTFD